ncbi:hypothetical protein [Nostoc sp. UHCC 0870]|nr:hypothetical protein [Nostoc sp. UHCC 0870]UKP00449.1 hypothetical protein L6494_12420 [Nostoc sp. UHCC 0870]
MNFDLSVTSAGLDPFGVIRLEYRVQILTQHSQPAKRRATANSTQHLL